MGKVSRLFKGELKKIFLGPGIFFMTAFLILLLTIAPKLYEPTTKSDLATTVNISTTTVEDAYTSFLDYKNDYSIRVNKVEDEIQELILTNANFKENLTNIANEVLESRMQVNTLILAEDLTGSSNNLTNLITKAELLDATYKSYMNNYTLPLILVNEELNDDFTLEIAQLLRILNQTGNKSTLDFYIKLNDTLNNYKCVANIVDYVSKIKNLDYKSDNLKNILEKYYGSQDKFKADVLTAITTSANEASSKDSYNKDQSKIEEMESLALTYLSVDDCSYYALRNALYLEVSANKSDAEMSSYIGFENFNSYQYRETLTKYDYLLNNNLADSDFATMFSFNANSGSSENAFDYMYFTLEIASFFIIAFTVVMGAGMISKEYSDGTIKLLAIRPYKRNKIILAKILATMFFAFIFVLVSVIVSLITGYILFGISFPNMLIVFNAAYTFTLPIWVVFLIYLASLMIKIWIFALLAIAISTIFKSYVAAVCISSGIYILNLILTFVSKGANWLKYNPFANLDLFKYFGGSFASLNTSQNLTSLFSSPVFADTSIWVTTITIGILATVLNIILFTVFKHRDIT